VVEAERFLLEDSFEVTNNEARQSNGERGLVEVSVNEGIPGRPTDLLGQA